MVTLPNFERNGNGAAGWATRMRWYGCEASRGQVAASRMTKAILLAARCMSWLERGVEERPKLLRARGVPQLAQRLRLDLADPLAGDVERAAHFLQGVLGAVADAEAHLEDLLFARSKRAENLTGLLLEVGDDDVIDRRDDAAILDEVAEMRVFLFSDGSLERDRLLR